MSDSLKRKEVQEAYRIFVRKSVLETDGLAEAIDTLVGHGIWSRRQIEAITGAGTHAVRSRATKTARTGGRFNPATLKLTLNLFESMDRNNADPELIGMICALGTSPLMLHRLCGIPESSIKHICAKQRNA